MANTTNFGWETPDDTDLVKDGAAAIRTLGSAIDTSLVDLKGGTTGQVLSKASNTDMDFTWIAQDDSNAIQNAIVDAKGDLITATAADTPARLAVGTNGQYLIADSTTATGLKWGDVSAGAYTVLASGTLSSTAVTISSISGSYIDLYLVVNNPYLTATGTALAYRCNGVTSGYYLTTFRSISTVVLNQGPVAYLSPTTTDVNLPTATNTVSSTLYIRNYTATTQKPVQTAYGDTDSGISYYGVGYINTTSAITSIQIRTVNGTSTFNGGTYTLYGVK